MHRNKSSIRCILALLLLLVVDYARPCSMFKITLFGKTMVGNNEDAWRVGSRIWFETGKGGCFGAAYVGHNDGLPQGGLNEAGLVYDGFAVYRRTLKPATGKKKIEDPGGFLKSILQQCASIREVQNFVHQYDRSRFNGSMLLFADKSGHYLVVEADTTIAGQNEKYVLSNFCPSQTPHPEEVKIERYRRGMAFLQNKEDTSLRFCTSMMDTMHECRAKIGDGTTYTTIYDLTEKLIYLYFYHDYRHCISFNLQGELLKGDHAFLMSDLFPPNPEYIRYTRFNTPFTNTRMRIILNLVMAFLILSLPCYLLIFLRDHKRKVRAPGMRKYIFIGPVLLTMNLCLAYYTYQLLSNKAIFYFDTPYTEDGRWLLNLSSYCPVALLFLFIPVMTFAVLYLRQSPLNKYYLALFILNAIGYGILLALFRYWGLYGIL